MAEELTEIEPITGSEFRFSAKRCDGGLIVGWIYDSNDPGRCFTIELYLDGTFVSAQRADAMRFDIVESQVAPPRCGFTFVVERDVLDLHKVAWLSLANLNRTIARFELGARRASDWTDHAIERGAITWRGGAYFDGWVRLRPDNVSECVSVYVDGMPVLSVMADGWGHVTRGDHHHIVRTFRFVLPETYRRLHLGEVTAVCADDFVLLGSPVVFAAFENGLTTLIRRLMPSAAETKLGELFDNMHPNGIPFVEYEPWRESWLPSPSAAEMSSAVVVLVGDDRHVDVTLQSIYVESARNVSTIVMPQVDSGPSFDPHKLKAFLDEELEIVNCIIFAPCGTIFKPNSIERLARNYQDHNEQKFVFADILEKNATGDLFPVAFPCFDYERWIEQGYGSFVFATSREYLLESLGRRPQDLYALTLSLLEVSAPSQTLVGHLPGPVAVLPERDLEEYRRALQSAVASHLAARRMPADVMPNGKCAFPSVRVARTSCPSTADIVVLAHGDSASLRACIASCAVASKQSGSKIIIVGDDRFDGLSVDEILKEAGVDASVHGVRSIGNDSQLRNCALEYTSAPFVCFVDESCRPVDDDWLDELLGRAAEPDVAAVGPLLTYPDGFIAHAGYVLGPRFGAVGAFGGRSATDPGYSELLRVARSVSSVQSSCVLFRRTILNDISGFDETHFPTYFADVDINMKTRSLGYRTVITPHVRAIVPDSRKFSPNTDIEREVFARALENLRARWGRNLLDDPFYSPILSIHDLPFDALAHPPRSLAVRGCVRPIARDVPFGL